MTRAEKSLTKEKGINTRPYVEERMPCLCLLLKELSSSAAPVHYPAVPPDPDKQFLESLLLSMKTMSLWIFLLKQHYSLILLDMHLLHLLFS